MLAPAVNPACGVLSLIVVSFVMSLDGFLVMVTCVQIMSMRELCMMRRFFMMTCFGVLCRFSVMFGGMFVMIGCFGMMFVSFD